MTSDATAPAARAARLGIGALAIAAAVLLSGLAMASAIDDGAALRGHDIGSALMRVLVYRGLLHALIVAIGGAAASVPVERRFGWWAALLVFALGALLPAVLTAALAPLATSGWLAASAVGGTGATGASGGVMALLGLTLFDRARRGDSHSLFGQIIGPIVFMAVVEILVPGDWSFVHGAGFAVGAAAGVIGSRRRVRPVPIGEG